MVRPANGTPKNERPERPESDQWWNQWGKWPSSGALGLYPSGNLLHSYWKWPFIVSFPIKNGDFPYSYVSLPEGTPLVLEHGYGKKPLFRQIIERITWAIFVASLAILREGSDSWIELCFRTTEVNPVSNLKIMSCFVSPTFSLLCMTQKNKKNWHGDVLHLGTSPEPCSFSSRTLGDRDAEVSAKTQGDEDLLLASSAKYLCQICLALSMMGQWSNIWIFTLVNRNSSRKNKFLNGAEASNWDPDTVREPANLWSRSDSVLLYLVKVVI